jgi:anthranilate/para-aminobenzoate synthase component II
LHVHRLSARLLLGETWVNTHFIRAGEMSHGEAKHSDHKDMHCLAALNPTRATRLYHPLYASSTRRTSDA